MPSRPHLRLAEVPEHRAAQEPPVVDLDAAFRRYAPYVARVAMRLLGTTEGVEDIVQDTFLDAQRGIRGLRDPAAIKGWLATIAVRRVRRRLRKVALFRWVGLDDAEGRAELLDRTAPPDKRASLAQLYRVLDELPVEQRIAWSLRHVEELGLLEVAQTCGCSRATAHRRISAAQKAIERAVTYGS